MSTISSAAFVTALKAEGVYVVGVNKNGVGWWNHSRPASLGAFDGHGVMNHHTGPFSTVEGMVSLIWNGRSDLPGPLATCTIAPDGKVYLVGWNRCNHAGKGDKDVYNAVLNGTTIPKPNSDDVDGNSAFYGIEVMHPGNSTPYPNAQIQALVKVNAAIHRAHKWDQRSSIHHKEWTTRKTDMSWHGSTAGPDLRKLIQSCLALPAGKWTLVPPAPAPTPAPTPTPTPTPVPGGVTVVTKSQVGTVTVAFSNSETATAKLVFSGLAAAPKVLTTVNLPNIIASPTSVTSSGAVVNLRSTTGPITASVVVTWLAAS